VGEGEGLDGRTCGSRCGRDLRFEGFEREREREREWRVGVGCDMEMMWGWHSEVSARTTICWRST
jgi:hypothetical protein